MRGWVAYIWNRTYVCRERVGYVSHCIDCSYSIHVLLCRVYYSVRVLCVVYVYVYEI